MATLIVKDGNGSSVNLKADNGDSGLVVPNHALTSVVSDCDHGNFYPTKVGGWKWNNTSDCTAELAEADLARKGIIIHNSGSLGTCYVLLTGPSPGTNNGFGTLTSLTERPSNYTFLIEPGGTYFGDTNTAALKHNLFVPSSSLLTGADVMYVTVTEIY